MGNSSFVYWTSSTIKRVVRSALAAEAYSVSEAVEEAQWLRSVLAKMWPCHNSHYICRLLDEGPGPLPFVACGDERTSLRVCDFRVQHRWEDNHADALRACTNSQDGNWISADTISRIAFWKVWSKHSLNPVESAVSEIDILVFLNERLLHRHCG